MAGCMRECVNQVNNWKKVIITVVVLYLTLGFLYQYQYESIVSLLPATLSGRKVVNEDSSALRVHIHQWLAVDGKQNQTGNSTLRKTLDIHLEHPVLGHTAEVNVDHPSQHVASADSHKTVAIGGGITSSKLQGVTTANIPQKFQFFTTLLPSFCKTVSKGFHYHFYLAYDGVDKIFTDKALAQAFHDHFMQATGKLCPKDQGTDYSLHLVQCSHHMKPAWAQNDAMMEAYLDNIEYFYRINDDSDLKSADWTNLFIQKLGSYKPQNVGVVGPHHQGGNTAILTYDFTHKTHVDIFGFYYPRFFTDWYADDWVTKVYPPERSTKMSSVRVMHTMKLGQRYKVDWTKSKHVGQQINKDKKTLNRYLQYKQKYPKPPVSDGSKVISMSLYGKDPFYTIGAIRNAQITPVFFPGWTLRVYVAYAEEKNETLAVPHRILSKLLNLGAELAYVNTSAIKIAPKYWRYLVADDEKVKVFVVRNAEQRLRDRDAEAVDLWLQNWQPFHCVRDHPKHESLSIVEGLWGAKTESLKLIMGISMLDLLQTDAGKLMEAMRRAPGQHKLSKTGQVDLLQDVIWALVKNFALCHDSVSCTKWPSTQTFPVPRSDSLEYLGEKFDIHHQSIAEDKKAVRPGTGPCVGKQPVVAQVPSGTLLSKGQGLLGPTSVSPHPIPTTAPIKVMSTITSRAIPQTTTPTTSVAATHVSGSGTTASQPKPPK